MGEAPSRNPDLLRGTVELLILKALTHGRQRYDRMLWIVEAPGGVGFSVGKQPDQSHRRLKARNVPAGLQLGCNSLLQGRQG